MNIRNNNNNIKMTIKGTYGKYKEHKEIDKEIKEQ